MYSPGDAFWGLNVWNGYLWCILSWIRSSSWWRHFPCNLGNGPSPQGSPGGSDPFGNSGLYVATPSTWAARRSHFSRDCITSRGLWRSTHGWRHFLSYCEFTMGGWATRYCVLVGFCSPITVWSCMVTITCNRGRVLIVLKFQKINKFLNQKRYLDSSLLN